MQRGGLICLKNVMKGHFNSLKADIGFGMFNGKYSEVFDTINSSSFINHLDSKTALELIDVNNKFI